ncbi:MAG TPA: DUF3011 domain-containing protein [Arenimonas sp.]|uniref:DUF3011 domain-containing protein n=1 Tax=Arenimonas sp. TaxID=1872635 RepID=UPI002D7F282D|nr:DUF3011 domain-containing protein [Arenimonas sp.]HEU0152969.1 DUF3011 domain-containing protein [Arenimonas sp.]
MNRIVFALVAFATAALPLLAQASDRHDARNGYDRGRAPVIVSCNSDRYRERFCPVDTRGGVRLVRQVSDSRGPCIEGRSWGYDRRGIWVTNGCRAQFEVGTGYAAGPGRPGYGRPDPGPRIVRCESVRNRETYCAVPGGRIESVDIHRRLSKADCTYREGWGFNRRGIWVDRGCRADFIVY